MQYEEALSTAGKVLADKASLADLVQVRNDLRALAPDSRLAELIEERITRILKDLAESRLVSDDLVCPME